METVVRNVKDLDQPDRSALERVVGHQLRETQQVIVNVVNLDLSAGKIESVEQSAEVPDWWKVYDGLTDDEVDELDASIQRANLTRRFE